MSCKVITVTSFKGGVGKSTVAVNLGYALASTGKKTLLVDCDFRMRSLDVMLGVEDEIVHDAGDVLAGRVPLNKAVITDRRCTDLLFLPAPFNFRGGIDRKAFADMMSDAEAKYGLDCIVLDTPGSSGDEFSAAAACSDLAFIVATHSFPSVRAAECTGAELEAMGVPERRLIINMFDTSGREAGRRPSIIQLIDRTALKLGGVIPYDGDLVHMQDEGRLLDTVPGRNISKAFLNICKRADGRSVPLFTGFKGINRKRLLND